MWRDCVECDHLDMCPGTCDKMIDQLSVPTVTHDVWDKVPKHDYK
jgi:radical SAM protein with 4Fe4S-binding SPASM domain